MTTEDRPLRILHALAAFDDREAQGASVATTAAHVPGEHHLVTARHHHGDGLASIDVLDVPLTAFWTAGRRGLAAAVARVQPDVVHLHGGPFTVLSGPSGWTAGVPVVASLYAWPRIGRESFSRGVPLRHAMRTPVLAPRTLANTLLPLRLVTRALRRNDVSTVLTSDPAIRDRLATAGIVTGFVEGVTPPRPGDNRPVPGRFVFAGKAELTRGPDLLAAAVAALRAEGVAAEAHLLFLDDPPTELARRLDLDGCTIVRGPRDLTGAMREAAAVVLPFRHDSATLHPAYVAAEAQAAGVPVVVADVACLRGAVVDGVTGRIVPPDDVPALTAALRPLALGDAAVAHWGAAALRESERRWHDAGLPTLAAWAYDRAAGSGTAAVQHFDGLAAAYHEHAFSGAGLAELSRRDLVGLAAAVQRAPGRAALDVGVGTGRISTELARLGCTLTGVEASEGMMEQAVERLAAAGVASTLHLADVGEGLPFADAAFDVVSCLRVLKYVPDWRHAVAELGRVCRPGGIVWLDLANGHSLARFGYPEGLVWPCTWREVNAAFAASGLEVLAVDYGPHLPEPLWRAASGRHSARIVAAAERAATRLSGRHGARSWTFTLRRSSSQDDTGGCR